MVIFPSFLRIKISMDKKKCECSEKKKNRMLNQQQYWFQFYIIINHSWFIDIENVSVLKIGTVVSSDKVYVSVDENAGCNFFSVLFFLNSYTLTDTYETRKFSKMKISLFLYLNIKLTTLQIQLRYFFYFLKHKPAFLVIWPTLFLCLHCLRLAGLRF